MKENKEVPFSDIERARQIRKIRAELKRDIKDGNVLISDVFADGERFDMYFANMKVHELICSLPGYGSVSTEKLLKKLGISHCKKLKGLGKKQAKDFFKYFNI